MKIAVFTNDLGLGGTEKAACRWACGLKARGHALHLLTLSDGVRRAELEAAGIPVTIVPGNPAEIATALVAVQPEVIHAHVPGYPHEGDLLGEALSRLPKIPVVQTNIFGRLENPKEAAWTDFRLFISWTSCVQAARRSFRKLDADFFQHASVAVYPLDAEDGPSQAEIHIFRECHGVGPDEVLFGRLSRPEPNKWTDLPLSAFRLALKMNPGLKLLLREPPPAIAQQLRNAPDADRFVILPATSDPIELRLTLASLDVVLHTSSIGESFGYGIAEPMNLGKPVIVNSTPWQDQAQMELIRHGEDGFHASTPETMAAALLALTDDPDLRERLGVNARRHIRALAKVDESLDRLEGALRAAMEGRGNPRREADLQRALATASHLDRHQFGHGWREQWALRPFYLRVRFHQWRQVAKARLFS